jgi:hypothetical protein
MLTKSDYQAALDVQSAVNLSGVVFKFADIMKRICVEAYPEDLGAPNKGTEWKNHHPIVRLFAETIINKSGGGTGTFRSYSEASDFCTAVVEGRHACLVLWHQGEKLEYEEKGDE